MQQTVCVGRKKTKKKNKEKKRKKKTKKIRPTQNTPRNLQQPSDRDHLEAARDETRPKRLPILACFHRSRVCGNWLRTALAIAYGKNGLGRFVPSACFFTANGSEKREKKTTHHRHQQSSQRPPQGIPLLQSCEVALERVSDPLGARGNILPASVGSAPTWSESLDDIQKNANLTLSCRLLERAPRASITRHTAVTIRHRIIDHHSRCPPTDPLPACCYRR